MTKLRLAAVLCAALALAAPAAAANKQPYELTRALQMLQENVARGSPTAQQMLQKFLPQMAEQFLKADAAAWSDDRNVRAVLIYSYSGGRAGVLRTLLGRGLIGESNLLLAHATLAYAEGRRDEAAVLLGPLDARSLPIGLAGYIALAQAVLIAETEPKKAMSLLDLARLLMPGTLVEEAALRREIIVAVRDGDIEKFERLSRQQITRFGRSLYAAAFRRQFADAVVRLDYGEGPGRFEPLESILLPMEPQPRRELYLMIARKAVIAGRTAVARFAADEAVRLTDAAGLADDRPTLYKASTMLVTDEFDTAVKTLREIDRKTLPEEDHVLLDNALTLAGKMREWPQGGGEEGPPNQHEEMLGGSQPTMTPSFKALLARAEDALAGVDADLQAASP